MQTLRKGMCFALLLLATTNAVRGDDGDRRGRGDRSDSFGKRARAERLAVDLYKQANTICWEMNRYYKQNSRYDENYRQMYQIREGAKRIHDMVNDGYHRRRASKEDRIEADLFAMDNLFHQIDSDVRRWRSNRRDESRGADLVAQMDQVEATLHQFMDDYGVKTKFEKGYGRRDDHDHSDRRGPRN